MHQIDRAQHSHDFDDGDDFEAFEDLTSTALRLRDVLDDICTQPIRSVEERRKLGQQIKLIGCHFQDVGGCLIDGTLFAAH